MVFLVIPFLIPCISRSSKVRMGGTPWDEPPDPQSELGQMKVKGQSKPEIVATAFLILEAWFWVHHLCARF